MRYSIHRRIDLDAARPSRTPCVVVSHRTLGSTNREDQELTVYGPVSPEAAAVVKALVAYLVDPDHLDKRQALKTLVDAL